MTSELFSPERPWIVMLIQSSACLAIGLAASYALRRRAARAHHALWIATLMAVLMPGAYWLVDRYELGVLLPVPEAVAAEPQEEAIFPVLAEAELVNLPVPEIVPDTTAIPAESEIVSEPVSTPVATPITIPWRTLGWALWLAVTTLFLGHLLLRFVLGTRLVRRSRPVENPKLHRALRTASQRSGVGISIALRQNSRVRSPIIWCWSSRPVLLVHDTSCDTDDRVDWTGIFCHELAHWKRRDHLTGLFVELLVTLLPWHPLLWWTRRRLTVLSEAVCDDWVVAAGQVGVDYAESLLNLSPQRQLAFLPTVVGKERAMKERIHRIIKDRCGNPRIGMAWTLAIVSLAALIVAGTALAQRRPAERPGPEQREMMELRRTILHQELDQLVDEVHNLEEVLEGQVDMDHPERAEHEALLDVKRELVGLIERQLRNLEQPARRGRERRGQIEARMEELNRHQDELREHAGNLERELEALGDRRPEAREQMEMQLREVHENLERLEMEKVELDRRQAGPGRREGRPEAEVRMEELNRRRDELREHAGNLERELEELGDRNPEARERMEMELREIHENLERMEMEKIEIDRAQARPRRREGRPEIDVRMENIGREQDELREHAGNLEREIRALGDRHPDERERMEMKLREVQENLERLEMEKIELDQQRGRARRREGRPEVDARMEEIERHGNELREHGGNLERELRALGDRDPEARERMQMELREVRQNLERLKMEQVELRRQRARGREAGQQEMNPEVRELTEHLRNLRQHGQGLREELGRVDDQDSERGQDLRRAMENTQQEMRNVQMRLREIAGQRRQERPARRRGPDNDPARALEGIMAQIRMAEEKLHAAEEAERPEMVERLRNVLEQLHRRREATEGRMRQTDRPGPGREEIQGQVEELRHKVDGMHEQMEEMRQMLQQLLEQRKEVRREVEVEVRR